jgi:EAL domain-containing protein (putative c-di-GMP-specific phosphodiesterase class I)
LTELGCEELQGYFFAKPLNAEALIAWVQQQAQDQQVESQLA